jgi:rod shape-determining protein MreD
VKFLVTMGMALVLLSLESVIVQRLGLSVTRIDVTVAIIAFLALRASTLEGAVSSFAVGYLLDLMSGRYTGLYTFLGVFLFLLGRLVASLVDVRSGPTFALYAMGGDVVHILLAVFFTWITSKEGVGAGPVLSAMPLQVLLTGLAALALYPLLRRVDPGSERPEIGALR